MTGHCEDSQRRSWIFWAQDTSSRIDQRFPNLQSIFQLIKKHSESHHRPPKLVRAGYGERLAICEQVKPLERAANSVGHNLPREVRNVYAVTGVALTIKNIGSNPADLWHSVNGNANGTAPREIQFRVGELRINLQHPWPKLLFDDLRVIAEVVAPPTEQ